MASAQAGQEALASASTGLDRAPIGTYSATTSDQQRGYLSQDVQCTHGDSEKSPTGTAPSVLAKIRHVGTKVKTKLHINEKEDDGTFVHSDQRVFDDAEEAPVLAPPASSARDNDRFFTSIPEKPSRPSPKEVALHPASTLRSTAGKQGGNAYADNLSKTDVPHGANVNVVRAYDHIARTTTVTDRTMAMRDLERLKKSRQDSFVRWTMDRHVQKLRRVERVKLPRRSGRESIGRVDDAKDRLRWKEYGQYLLDLYVERHAAQYIGSSDRLQKPTQGAVLAGLERVLLTSAPYQKFWIELRSISLWKKPKRSAAYMTVYLVIWWYDRLASSVLLLLLSMVIRRRYHQPTVEELRRDLERSEDTDSTALNIPQLIQQHGAQGWVNALKEMAGPAALSRLDDLADFLEVLQNFYEWRDSRRSAVTVGKLMLMSLIVSMTPTQMLVKGALFAVGFIFFVLTPIWHRYPRYSPLTSPLQWVFWKIPTHAEWAIARLKAEAAYQLRVMASAASEANNVMDTREAEAPTTDVADAPLLGDSEQAGRLIGRYHCTSRNRPGNLAVTTQDIAFKQHLTGDRAWRLNYDEIKAIQKVAGSSTISSNDDLLFIDIDGNEFRAAGLSARDKVFTQIVGYSKVQWQVTP